jgi:hypothetical protein
VGVLDEPEARLLLACARPRLEPLPAAVVAELVAGLDWTRAIERALHHGVAPALATGLAAAPPDLVPADIQDGLKTYCDSARARNAALTVELHAILAALAADGIQALPFKGPLLTEMLYGDLGQRAPGDLDFLVRRRDVTRSCDHLVARGYRDAHRSSVVMTAVQHEVYRRYQCEYQFVRDSDGMVVEPHWAFAQRMWAVAFDYEAQFARARPGTLAGVTLATQAHEDLLLLLCVHGAKHEWARLVWIRDVATLLDRYDLDSELALRRAREQGCARMLLVGVEVAHRLLGARVSAGLRRAIDDDPLASSLATDTVAGLFTNDREEPSNRRITRFVFRVHDDGVARARYVLRTLLMPRRDHIEMVALPAALAWLYYPLRWAHDYVALPLWRISLTSRPRRSSLRQ